MVASQILCFPPFSAFDGIKLLTNLIELLPLLPKGFTCVIEKAQTGKIFFLQKLSTQSSFYGHIQVNLFLVLNQWNTSNQEKSVFYLSENCQSVLKAS